MEGTSEGTGEMEGRDDVGVGRGSTVVGGFAGVGEKLRK